jgi:hypothetical protein
MAFELTTCFDLVVLKIATNGKAAGVIANRKSLKTIVGGKKRSCDPLVSGPLVTRTWPYDPWKVSSLFAIVVRRAGLEPATHWLKEWLSRFHPVTAV